MYRRRSIMLTLLLFLLLFTASVVSYPASTPLNQRHQEISWEAWLLIDDQNQATIGTGSGTPPRRRITPKSVFVAQPFSPENLPPCAEGYSSDEKERCVKIIKLDNDKHLDFLVSKLNDQFGSSFDYDTMLDESGQEPTRVDIPLNLDEGYSNDTPQGDLEMAIIVTPTTKESIRKRDQEQLIYEEELKKLANTKYEYTTYRESDSERRREERTTTENNGETTTSENEDFTIQLGNRFGAVDEDLTTTQTKTESEDLTTSTESVPETTTLKIADRTEFIDIPITTTPPSSDATTIMEGNIAELPSSTISTTGSSSTSTETTTEPLLVDITTPPSTTTTPIKITTYHPVATTYHPQFDFSKMSKSKNLIKFPEETVVVPRSHMDGNYVRFPDADDVKYQEESSGPHTRDVNSDTGNFFNEIVTPESSQVVNERVLPPKGNIYPKFFPSQIDPVYTATTERNYAKKPKVRKPLSFQRFSSAEERHRPIVLRSVPMDDLTYLFGYKQGQR
ncbi:uncharacterized protein LOC126737060 isoform X2 [Anthonomus grandis grandis]|uniref:uncharacterized protein LOC126737060 isoform X2 n=1 Tax=Anthonomus grandis grandis TaxID=2921223 RepID=UPI0021652C55|nr:uncharacterized protein LOC126737060 isoform X2 [Anthonomus grandis grandis]